MVTYKRTIYWLNTTRFCGQIAVDQDGKVYKYDSAPYWKHAHGKPFRQILDQLKNKKQMISMKKIDTDIDPF
jgi:hypothetical protein